MLEAHDRLFQVADDQGGDLHLVESPEERKLDRVRVLEFVDHYAIHPALQLLQDVRFRQELPGDVHHVDIIHQPVPLLVRRVLCQAILACAEQPLRMGQGVAQRPRMNRESICGLPDGFRERIVALGQLDLLVRDPHVAQFLPERPVPPTTAIPGASYRAEVRLEFALRRRYPGAAQGA